MELSKLNSTLREKAVASGLCAKWQREWREDWSKERMLEKFKDGIDFCLSNNYPGKDFIKENFTKDELREAGILVDDAWSLVNPKTAVLLGNSTSTIRYNGYNLGVVYVADQSTANVTAKNISRVVVHAFGNATVVAETQDNASILILRHSATVKTDNHNGKVTEKDELDLFS